MSRVLFLLSSGIIVLTFLAVSLGMLIVPGKAIRYFSRRSLLTNADDASVLS